MLQRIERACGASAWLNPSHVGIGTIPDHAIGGVFDINELTLDGIERPCRAGSPRPRGLISPTGPGIASELPGFTSGYLHHRWGVDKR